MSVTAARSVTAEARRAQIVAATIEVIAEAGYPQASFARIAAHAGLSSTRLISYHFAGRNELVGAVVESVVTAMGDEVGALVRAEPTGAGRLRAYIEGVVGYTAAHRAQLHALLQIVLAGGLRPGVVDAPAAAGHVEQILLAGQSAGEFRDFDSHVVAVAVQRAVEGLPFLLAAEPDLDCAGYARELVELFDRATRRDP